VRPAAGPAAAVAPSAGPTETAAPAAAPADASSQQAAPATPSPAAAAETAASGPGGGAGSTEASSAAAPPAAEPVQPARLVINRYGAPTGEEIPLLGDRLIVGRFDPETGPVDVDLSNAPGAEHISRQHGELYRQADGRWTVRDLGSTNGIFVRQGGQVGFGPRIAEPRPLSDGDEVAFGNARFTFRVG
jgi:hypothetical protein